MRSREGKEASTIRFVEERRNRYLKEEGKRTEATQKRKEKAPRLVSGVSRVGM